MDSRLTTARLPDGTPFVPWAGVEPFSARWSSALDDRQRALRAEWLARRARALERDTLDAVLAQRIDSWGRAGDLPRAIPTAGSTPEQMLLELACDAAVAASTSSTGANGEGLPLPADRALCATLMRATIAARRGPSRKDLLRIHAGVCPSLKPSPLVGPRREGALARGRLRRDHGFVLGSDRILKEGCPPHRLDLELNVLGRALAPAVGAPEIDPARAAWAMHALVMIHPFYDGNGRVGRLIASFILVRDGGMPLLLAPPMHGLYLDAVARAHLGEPEMLVRLIDECEGAVLEDLLAHIT